MGMHIKTCATKEGCAIAQTITNAQGGPVYDKPVVNAMENNPELMARLKIHEVKKQVDPDDPTQEKHFPAKIEGGFEPGITQLITIVYNATKNTAQNRELQSRAVCAFNNSREVQTNGYGNNPGHANKNNMMMFDGDVTPENLADAPPLSNFLTIGDCMAIIAEAHTNPQGNKPSDAAIVSNQEILDRWFSPDLHERVRSLYSGDGSLAPGFNLPVSDFN
jgi:hypothetical protein